jgi:iron complex outermembrane receptor protein
MAGRSLLLCQAMLLVAFSARAQVRPKTVQTDTAGADTSGRAVYRLPALEATVARGLLPLEDLPMASATLDRRVIRRARATVGLDEALVGVPGVEVDNRYNLALGSRISMRGFGARAAFGVRGIRILVDGIPLTLPDGQATLTNVDLGSAGRVQVLRGPSSLLYGNAAGGVIAIETEVPQAPRFAAFRAVAGDYGTGAPTNFWKLQASAGGRSERAGYIASLSHMSLGGFRAHSAARRNAFNSKLRYAPDDASQLTFVVNVASVPLAQNPGSLPADTARLHPSAAWPVNVATGSGETSTQAQAGVRYERRVGPGALDVVVYGMGRSVGTALPYGRFIRLHRRGGGVRITFRADSRVAGHTLTLAGGVDGDAQRDARQERDNVGGQPGDQLFRDELDRVTALGAFLLARIRALPTVDLTGGLRYDATSFAAVDHLATAASNDSGTRTLDAFSGSAGAVLHVTGGLSFYSSVSTSFQTPTTTELINAPPTPGDSLPSGFNPDLRPQTALNFEVGARGRLTQDVSGQLAVYTVAVRNALVPFQVASLPGRDFYRNAGRSRRRGIELGIRVQPARQVTLRASYTLSDFVFLDDGLPGRQDEGNHIPGVPENRFTLLAAWNAQSAFMELQTVAADRMFVNDTNTATNPPRAGSDLTTTADLRAGIRAHAGGYELAPFLALQNITNARYNSSVVVNAVGERYYEPAPGRAFLFGVTVTASHP